MTASTDPPANTEWDLTDETTLICAVVTDGCGNLVLLDSMRKEVGRARLDVDTPPRILGAIQRLLFTYGSRLT